ncbi:uncharacterized protein TRIVIDRAFT_68416 [Trichoderma virens Gv29-8]|uniref:Uncharacterized protein n=1 Tax=Hypocrea virens (strain Gv29-8 / FGSC 10586) TaxID=413071 RepID=G9N466_HYPVG|nr:uncharacterized protein TRIVIDRAFT_68416 [Trichoderma virens Gv29-8]EHK18392.1 hypothetical protein TRIVIDRAFT_68416 [Trichoderma virens Gv29-8]UKZ52606.1 hypothetical protein TrVGV298_006387 [Trichoderma virens]
MNYNIHYQILCRAGPNSARLQFPVAARLALPTFSNVADGSHVSTDETDLTGMVLRAILTQQFNWAGTVSKLLSTSAATHKEVSLVAFGQDRYIPPTIARLKKCG